MQIRVTPDPEKLSAAVAEYICDQALQCIGDRGQFTLVLSGGSTPERTYRNLVDLGRQHALDWSRIHIFWGDERCVPPDHIQSNYHMARGAFLDHVAIPEGNIHRIAGEDHPEAAAAIYESMLRDFFPGELLPHFDLVLLGLGEDGHTASLFPGTAILEERERWAVAVHVAQGDLWRISLTLPAINAATHIAFLVSGAGKATIVRELLEAPSPHPIYPAQRIHPQQNLSWFLDQAAGALLRSTQ
ncbi:MAG: 6-phosphogluconolactonase [Anaerolineales bacterium]|nr:MAG: 6-phosphogluconolactonase [Anaerolineales bacterium]